MVRRTSITLFFLISLIACTCSPVLGGYMEHYGILECFDCHDFNQDPNANLDFVRIIMATPYSGDKQVIYKNREGINSLADGDETYDGPCEVCHTQTVYHTNMGDSTSHFDGSRCTTCHDHFPGSGVDFFAPELPGPRSHETHLHAKNGPNIPECTDCHDAVEFALFADGKTLANTDICNDCHSPNGAFDGVNDPALGAKTNWQLAVYTTSGRALKEGKEMWCATCHDDGTSTIEGVTAPNVMGDSTSFGYRVTGHGQTGINAKCEDCHRASSKHIDGDQRTYEAILNNYLTGYRLVSDMVIPRYGAYGEEAFSLCFKCHLYGKVFGEASDFRNDAKYRFFHDSHLNKAFMYILSYDSDWNGGVDSASSCPACHNVHGSPTPAMIRHGELISSPGTNDKVPAFDFRWYREDGSTPTTQRFESRYGELRCGVINDLSYNYVCYGCHPTGALSYSRTPTDAPSLDVEKALTRKTNFQPGGSIQYKVKFTVGGPGDHYLEAEGWAYNLTGKDWATKFSRSETLSSSNYTWTWNRTIPGEAKPGSRAILRIIVRMYDAPKGTLLFEREATKKFRIAE